MKIRNGFVSNSSSSSFVVSPGIWYGGERSNKTWRAMPEKTDTKIPFVPGSVLTLDEFKNAYRQYQSYVVWASAEENQDTSDPNVYVIGEYGDYDNAEPRDYEDLATRINFAWIRAELNKDAHPEWMEMLVRVVKKLEGAATVTSCLTFDAAAIGSKNQHYVLTFCPEAPKDYADCLAYNDLRRFKNDAALERFLVDPGAEWATEFG